MSLFSGESKSKTENIQSEEIKILATNLEVLNRLLSKTGVQDNSNQGEDPILLQKIQQLQEKILYVEKAYKDENLKIYQKLKDSVELLRKIMTSKSLNPPIPQVADNPEFLKKQEQMEEKIADLNLQLINVNKTISTQEKVIDDLLTIKKTEKIEIPPVVAPKEDYKKPDSEISSKNDEPKIGKSERFFVMNNGKAYDF